MNNTRPRIGFVEFVTVSGKIGEKTLVAKIDTGADKSSILSTIADEIGAVPTAEPYITHYPGGSERVRQLYDMEIRIRGFPFREKIVYDPDRANMDYQALIGKDLLKRSNFLIDPQI